VGYISRNNNFDLLRLFAALQVLYTHSVIHLNLWPGPHWLYLLLRSLPGVPIFFVISGFLVTDSYLRSLSAGGFAIRRILRIYPALIVNIAMVEMIVAITGGFSPLVDALNYVAYLTVFAVTASANWADFFFDSPYISAGMFERYPTTGVLWTLTVELTFYFALPLLIEAWRRSPKIGAFYLASFGLLSMYLSLHFNVSDKWNTFVSLSIGPYFWIFAFGVAARLYWSNVRLIFEDRAAIWLIVLVTSNMFLPEGSAPNFYSHPSLIVFATATLMAGTVISVAFTHPRPEVLRGYDISYGVYLWHILPIYTMIILGWTERLRYWPVIVGASIALALLSFVLVERPTMNLRQHQPTTRSRRSGLTPVE
jgi:peptidoglycan/LPS O-acetylase OafA/YrhL